MRMPDFEADIARDLAAVEQAAAHLFRRHGTPGAARAISTAPAAIIGSDPREEPMSVIDTLEADAKALAAKFQTIDRDALAKVDAIKANPEAASVLDVLSEVASVALPAGVLHNAGAVFNDLLTFAKVAAGTSTQGTTAAAPVTAAPASDAPAQPAQAPQAAAQPAAVQAPHPAPSGPVIGGQAR